MATGMAAEEALDEVGMVVEGVEMLRTISRLERLNLTLPLFSSVRNIVEGQRDSGREALMEVVLNYGAPTLSGKRSETKLAAEVDSIG